MKRLKELTLLVSNNTETAGMAGMNRRIAVQQHKPRLPFLFYRKRILPEYIRKPASLHPSYGNE